MGLGGWVGEGINKREREPLRKRTNPFGLIDRTHGFRRRGIISKPFWEALRANPKRRCSPARMQVGVEGRGVRRVGVGVWEGGSCPCLVLLALGWGNAARV